MDFLVYNDETGEFVAAEDIQAVTRGHHEGSIIWIRGYSDTVFSPLKPRELLKRLTIMRYKRENGEPKTRTYAEASG